MLSYDFSNPISSALSQIIWRATTTIGCGIAWSADKKKLALVIRYQVGGNVNGQFFENVKPLADGAGGSSSTGTTTTTESPTSATSLAVGGLDAGSLAGRFSSYCISKDSKDTKQGKSEKGLKKIFLLILNS